MGRKISALLTVSFILCLSSLAFAQLKEPEPQLYQNKYLQKVGPVQASADIAQCKQKAQSYISSSAQSGDTLKKGARNAAKGAALGAVGGAVMGKNVGRATGAGAAIGGTATVVNKVSERGARNPAFQQYVNSCLEDLGYKVIEWR